MFANLSGWHFLIILFIILLLFGAPKLPGLAKSLGQSMKILKKEVREVSDDDAPANGGARGRAAEDRAAQDRVADDRAAQGPAAPTYPAANTAPGCDRDGAPRESATEPRPAADPVRNPDDADAAAAHRARGDHPGAL